MKSLQLALFGSTLASCAGSFDLLTLTELQGVHHHWQSNASEDLCSASHASLGVPGPSACPSCDLAFVLELTETSSWSFGDYDCTYTQLTLGFVLDEGPVHGEGPCAAGGRVGKAGAVQGGDLVDWGAGELVISEDCEAQASFRYSWGDEPYGRSHSGEAVLNGAQE